MTYQEKDQLVQKWMRDFDSLCREQGTFGDTIRRVEVNGEKYEHDAFLKLKWEEFTNTYDTEQ